MAQRVAEAQQAEHESRFLGSYDDDDDSVMLEEPNTLGTGLASVAAKPVVLSARDVDFRLSSEQVGKRDSFDSFSSSLFETAALGTPCDAGRPSTLGRGELMGVRAHSGSKQADDTEYMVVGDTVMPIEAVVRTSASAVHVAGGGTICKPKILRISGLSSSNLNPMPLAQQQVAALADEEEEADEVEDGDDVFVVDTAPSSFAAAAAAAAADTGPIVMPRTASGVSVDTPRPPKARRLTDGLSTQFLSYLQLNDSQGAEGPDETCTDDDFKPASPASRQRLDSKARHSTGKSQMRRDTSGSGRPPASDSEQALLNATLDAVSEATSHLELGRPSQIELVLPRSVSELNMGTDMTDIDKQRHRGLLNELEKYQEKIVRQRQANYVLEQDVRNLDDKIGLLITHRMVVEETDTDFATLKSQAEGRKVVPEKYRLHYQTLFKLMHSRPRYIALLSRQLRMSEIDDFLHTVMFTLFGNDDRREEYLLLTMFERALKMEFHTAPDLGSLMRSNTAMSRMMTTYTRRGSGQNYLRHTLLPQINLLMELDDNVTLEIDPLKVYAELARGDPSLPSVSRVTPEEALQNDLLRQKISERCDCLKQMADKFVKAMIVSLDKVPYGVRWLCKTIRTLTRNTYPSATSENIMSLIGGFFLLRYVNPAIVTPEAFGIVNHKPGPVVRRNLILVAKILQSLANGAAQSKEFFMQPLNPYIKVNQGRLHGFFNDLCEVEDFYDQYKMDTIGALAEREHSIYITPNEVFTVHRLLEKYNSKMDLGADDELNNVLEQLPAPPELLSRKDNNQFELQLVSHIKPRSRMASFSSNASNFSERARSAREREQGSTARSRAQLLEELDHTKRTFDMMCDNYEYLKEKISSYEKYLSNVRGQAISVNTLKTEFPSIDITQTEKKLKTGGNSQKGLGPFHFKLTKLDRAEAVLETCPEFPSIADANRAQIVVTFAMPSPGLVQFTIRKKGRTAIFHKQCNFEEILSKMEDDQPVIELGKFIQLDARKTLVLLDATIFR